MDSISNNIFYPGHCGNIHSFAECTIGGTIHVTHANFVIVLGRKVVYVDVHFVAVGKGSLAMTLVENSAYVLEEDDPLSILHHRVECRVVQ